MASGVVILGIDPGLDCTGYGVIESGAAQAVVLREGGVIRTDRRDPLATRIGRIHEQVARVLDEFRPDCVAVEQLYAHYRHPRTAILMGHARGAILLAAFQHGVEVTSLSATTIKKHLAGAGHASKGQVQRAVAAVFKLRAPPEPPDVADALAVAVCAAGRLARASR